MSAIYFYLFFIIVHPILSQWWKVFPKANRKSWEAFIPFYNYCVASKIGGLPFWNGLLMIFPGVHVVMWFVFNLAMQRRFGFFSLKETALAIILPWIQFAKISSDSEIVYVQATDWMDKQQVDHRTPGDHLVLFMSLPFAGHVLAYGLGSIFKPAKGKTSIKDWGETIIFALVAASIIRTYVFEPFKIPTGSMEKTLLVGDFLFVNKLAYGPKVPNTPLSFPLFHNNIPILDIPSYSGLETVDYVRLPGWSDVNRYDVVVFNYPSGDTAIYDPRMPFGLMGHDYHGIVINEARRLFVESKNSFEPIEQYFYQDYNTAAKGMYSPKELDSLSKVEGLTKETLWVDYEKRFWGEFLSTLELWKNKARNEIAVNKRTYSASDGQVISHKGVIYRPVDKRENYIKRCVGIPDDTLEIIDAQLFVNGKKAPVFEKQNLGYVAEGMPSMGPEAMEDRFGLVIETDYKKHGSIYELYLTDNEISKLKKAFPDAIFHKIGMGNYSPNLSDMMQKIENLRHYPKHMDVNNSTENFQKFWIPKKGKTIPLTKENIIWYGRIINAYERHTLEQKEGKILIDGKEAKNYTFEMNYYWMMGDNRYNSADSRIWGFVPEDHIVGRAAIVWFSVDQRYGFTSGIRWNRVFSKIK